MRWELDWSIHLVVGLKKKTGKMKTNILLIIGLLILIHSSCSSPNESKNKEPDFVQSFEADLNDPNGGETFKNSVLKRFDTSRYGEFILKRKVATGDTACLIYHADDPNQDETLWKTQTVNFAIKLVKKEEQWVVHAYNTMPGNKVEDYDDWFKFQGCEE